MLGQSVSLWALSTSVFTLDLGKYCTEGTASDVYPFPHRYLINFLLDATVGMLLIYVGVRAVSVLVEWQQWESLRFGEYGNTPRAYTTGTGWWWWWWWGTGSCLFCMVGKATSLGGGCLLHWQSSYLVSEKVTGSTGLIGAEC